MLTVIQQKLFKLIDNKIGDEKPLMVTNEEFAEVLKQIVLYGQGGGSDYELNEDEYNAIHNSFFPSLLNPFITKDYFKSTLIKIVLTQNEEEVVVNWTQELLDKHGNKPMMALYEVLEDNTLVETTSKNYTEGGNIQKWYVSKLSSRNWEVRILGYLLDNTTPGPDPLVGLGFTYIFPVPLS